MTKFNVYVKADRILEILEDWFSKGECDVVIRSDMKVEGYRLLMSEDPTFVYSCVERLHLEQPWNFVKIEY